MAALLVLLCGAVLYLVGVAYLDQEWGRIVKDLGGLVAATISIGLLYEFFVREEHDQDVLEKLKEILASEDMVRSFDSHDTVVHQQLGTLLTDWLENNVSDAAKYGFRGFVSRISYERIFADLRPGDELLWLNNYCPDHPRYRDPLIKAVRDGAHVKLLVAKPGCETSVMRAREIETFPDMVDRVQVDVDAEVASLRGAAARLSKGSIKGSLLARTYDDLPGLPMYIRIRDGQPDFGLTGFYLAEASLLSPHCKWSSAPDGGMLASFVRYYHRKWESAESSEFVSLSAVPTQTRSTD